MAKGVLYVMTTVVKGLVKIGKTGTGNFENRMRELENNGYANVPVSNAFSLLKSSYGEKETLLHDFQQESGQRQRTVCLRRKPSRSVAFFI